jgi:hypothetical protein
MACPEWYMIGLWQYLISPAADSKYEELRNEAGAIQRPSGPVAEANSPIMNEPEMLTMSVPQGKVCPNFMG